MASISTVTFLVTACLLFQAPSPARDKVVAARNDLADLAGDYFRGDGLGFNQALTVEAKGRFSNRFIADVGGGGREEGTAAVVDGRLSLHTEDPDAHKTKKETPQRYLPVRWGNRLYLLEEGEALGFCNAVNLGVEPRKRQWGRYYLRMDLRSKRYLAGYGATLDSAEGRPELPKDWRPFLLAKPLRGSVTAVAKNGRISIDLGSSDGLRVGMELWVRTDSVVDDIVHKAEGFVTVTEVGPDTCKAEVKWTVHDRIEDYKAGHSVYSRMPEVAVQEEGRRDQSFSNPKANPGFLRCRDRRGISRIESDTQRRRPQFRSRLRRVILERYIRTCAWPSSCLPSCAKPSREPGTSR